MGRQLTLIDACRSIDIHSSLTYLLSMLNRFLLLLSTLDTGCRPDSCGDSFLNLNRKYLSVVNQ